MTKQDQLKKNRKDNPKRLSAVELADYKNFIFAKQGGLCFCGCGREISEYHHAYFGINKNDKYLVGIAQNPCHYAIHHGRDIELKNKLVLVAEIQGVKNWKEFSR